MMKANQAMLLDCTLRDGGYLNDWEFGHDSIVNIFERLVSTNVEVIEIGFLDERRPFDINRSIMPDTSCVEKIYGRVNKKNALVVGMIDFGTCSIEHIQPCAESYLDGIRVIFKKHIMHEAIEFCKQLKSLGYKVFTQAVSITSYTDEQLLELIDSVNELEPFAVSMVDTYGLLHQDNLMHIFHILDENLKTDIRIGYHAHNNFQMGYANCIEFLSQPVKRTLLVDGTLYGMGKSAGNAPLELLAMHMNECCDKHYDVGQMLEAISTSVMDMQSTCHWGYSLFFFVAASNKCHPNYVKYFMNKKTLSIKAINQILSEIEPEKLLMYDQKHAEALYLKYQANECDDTQAIAKLRELFAGKSLLVFGPGKSMTEHSDAIRAYIDENRPMTVAVNYLPKDFKTDMVFLTNSKRYIQLASLMTLAEYNKTPIIATSNVTQAGEQFPYVLNYSSLIDPQAEYPDNSLMMLLRVLMKLGVRSVALAGFDGYTAEGMNYFNTMMEYSFAREKADVLNAYAKHFLTEHSNDLQVTFVTPSYYAEGES